MNMEASSHPMEGNANSWLAFLLMWFLMTIAMMLPLAAAGILKFYRFARSQSNPMIAVAFSGMFVVGYLLPWIVFGAVIDAGIVWGQQNQHLENLQPFVVITTLLTAGLYQFTSFKRAFLNHSQSSCVIARNAELNAQVAFVKGIQHGNGCIGSCWGLMLVLLIFDAMNWVSMGIAIAIGFAERLVRWKFPVHHLVGLGFVSVGIWAIVRSFFIR
ncbi:metal-binding integral membrane protein, putative (plasmid) [Leptolyngbya sp. NIES-3755]|nr:metal-binding integral membrane protein, putative [Leptolyngbya sp. NIES-3755]